MANPIVVDLSHWNPEPDWAKLKAGGTAGVIMKATQGTSYVDETYYDRCGRAAGAGLYVSGYHFMEHGNIDKQMANFTKQLDRTIGKLAGDRRGRAVLDYEDYAKSDPTLDDLCSACYALKMDNDYEVTVYSGNKIKADLGKDYAHDLAETSLWIAQYTNAAAPTWPKNQWPVWSLWQYTDKANVDGISAPVDGNRWNGSPDALADWFYAPPGGEEPAPLPQSAVVTIAIDVPYGVTVDVLVNGKEYG